MRMDVISPQRVENQLLIARFVLQVSMCHLMVCSVPTVLPGSLRCLGHMIAKFPVKQVLTRLMGSRYVHHNLLAPAAVILAEVDQYRVQAPQPALPAQQELSVHSQALLVALHPQHLEVIFVLDQATP